MIIGTMELNDQRVITFRKGVGSDAGIIRELWKELLSIHAQYEPEYYALRDEGLDYYVNHVSWAIQRKDGIVIIAEEEDSKDSVGFLYGMIRLLSSVFQPLIQAYVSDVYVRPAYQRMGIGKMLMQFFLDWAKEKKATNLTLNVHAMNQGALRFYEKIGLPVKMYILRGDIKDIKIQ